MPGVETRNLPSLEELTSIVERRKASNNVDRLIALYYLEVNGGKTQPTEAEIARVQEVVRATVDPDIVQTIRDSLVANCGRT